ncbi:septal ring lytic transglycosylase RlpA family protein [Cellvibrio sp. pealriver]|uniref:septal ring lytic transglycosylase RlpA family protein n=1 Tax=Cellvibrio sp. pealriver TaxID=1622269 RepID=UPI00066FDC30|nr:septal ring lytic transglycosylase RlpA family protein [Cellvibrio sp. pealriver]
MLMHRSGYIHKCAGIVLLLCCALMVACSSKPVTKKPVANEPFNPNEGRYKHDKDFGPDEDVDLSHIPDAVPRYETRTRAGNKNPYTVLGKTYHLIKDESSYRERGYASWYGKKFNGYNTSNGERYDMYAMTGAHKTLPIPSYVRVTNLDNGKSVVVRINDRGPFHQGRIIDLSYAAAQRIGIHKTGTGRVEVEIALPGDAAPIPRRPDAKAVATVESALPAGTYLQIGAFSQKASAQQFSGSVGAKLTYPVIINSANQPKQVHRVRVGPFKDAKSLQDARDQLAKLKIFEAHVVYQ